MFLNSKSQRNLYNNKNNTFVVEGRLYTRGAINMLRKSFYGANFRFPSTARRRGKHSSSVEIGARLHRFVYHEFVCVERSANVIDLTKPKKSKTLSACDCKHSFGTITRSPKPNSKASNFLSAFKNFLSFHNWVVLTCELPVALRETNIATAIDVVCTGSDPSKNEIFIIEVKTGYLRNRHKADTTDTTGKMRGAYGKTIPNTIANHHQLQLWFGVEAFEDTHNIKVDRAVVVYLKNDGKFTAEFGAPWWFNSSEGRKKLKDQLLITACLP